MASFPGQSTPAPTSDSRNAPTRRTRGERGVATPSPLVMLSVIAVAMASVTFFATRNPAPTERRVDTASAQSVKPTTPVPTTEVTPEPKPKPQLQRGEIYVEVYNNSGIKGLAATTAAKATTVGWSVVGEDNWYGAVPTTTVYFPPRLKAAARQLALDLGIKRTAPAVGDMKRDRLTVILTTDAPQ